MDSNDDELKNLLNSDDENEINEYNVDMPKISESNIKQMISQLQQMSNKDRNNFLENIMNNFNINNNNKSFDTTDPKELQRLRLKQKINNSKMKRQGKANLKNTLNKVKKNNLPQNDIDNKIDEINKKKKRNRKNKLRKKRKKNRKKNLINNNNLDDIIDKIKNVHSTVNNDLLINYIDQKILSLQKCRDDIIENKNNSLNDLNNSDNNIDKIKKLNPLQKNTFLINILKYTLNDLKSVKKKTENVIKSLDSNDAEKMTNDLLNETNQIINNISVNDTNDKIISKYFLNENII